MRRRSFLTASAALPVAAVSRPAAAAPGDFPSRPIQVIVPYAPGGADSYVRPLQPMLEKNHGMQLVIESVVGAGGTIGSSRVKRSAPDGHTLLFCGSGALTIAPKLQQSGAPTLADFVPVLNLVDSPYLIAVRKSMLVRNAAQFIDYVKRNPGKLNYGSPGTGSAPHLGMEAFALKLGTSMVHVPFAGVTAAMQALLGGHIDAIIGAPSTVVAQMRSGAVVGIAVTSRERFPFAPALPTLIESGANVDVVTHFGFLAPRGTGPSVVQKLAAALRDAASDPSYARAMETLQTTVNVLPADALARELASEEERFAPVIASVRKP